MLTASSAPLYSVGSMAERRSQRVPARNEGFISWARDWSWIALVIAIIYQSVFFASLPNFVAIGCSVIVWAVFSRVFLHVAMIRAYPLSTFLLLGFTTTQLYFPLLFTSLEDKPVIYNLDLPYEVFIHSTASFVVLTLGHKLYRSLNWRGVKRSPSLLIKLGFFDAPADSQLWLMGIIGLAATYYVYLYSPSIGWEVTGAASDKLVQAMMPFSYAPYFIPFASLYGRRKLISRQVVILLLTFTLLLFLVSIGRNSRAGFMIGFSSVGFAYGLGLLLNVFKAHFLTVKNFFIALGAYLLFTGPIADIGTAMVIVRDQRHDISYLELIEHTMDAFNDKEAIRQARLLSLEQNEEGEWDENYLDNIFLARFCNIKFNDASLGQAAKIPENNHNMLRFSNNYIWATLPQPVLDALGMNEVDKVMLKGTSFGDYIFYTAGASPEVLGGFRVGHFAGVGMSTYGWWYLLLLGIGIIPVYFLMDMFCLAVQTPILLSAFQGMQLRFSLCGLLALDYIFRFLPTESVLTLAAFLLRDWFQLILLYFIVYHATRLISRLGTAGPMVAKTGRHLVVNAPYYK